MKQNVKIEQIEELEVTQLLKLAEMCKMGCELDTYVRAVGTHAERRLKNNLCEALYR